MIVRVTLEALVAFPTPNLNSIEPFAPGQLFRVLLVFGGAFSLVITCYLLLIQLLESQLPFYIKHLPKSLGWERFAH